MTPKKPEPLQVESILWSTANVVKLTTLAVGFCSLYFALRADMREFVATQMGKDNVQDVLIQGHTRDITDLNYKVNQYVSREATLPKQTLIESE
jgi:hypothetical protein